MDVINYWPLFIVLLIAWVVPLALSWLEIGKIPAVIVEIIMGVMIGPFVFDLVEDTRYMDFLANTGFLFLIFLAGLEINVDKIVRSLPRSKPRMIDLLSNPLLLAIFIYFSSLLLSFPFALLLDQFKDVDVLFFTLLMPSIALSIIVPILKADGELTRKFGQVLLMTGAIATIMSIILIAVYSGILKNGFEVELFLFSIIFVVFIVTYWAGKRITKVRTFQQLQYKLEHAASQIRVRGAVVLLLLFVIVAHWIETELVLGAFFAGALLSMFVNKERSALLFKLDGMSYGFFIPIFFIMVGVNLDLSALTHFNESIPFILTIVAGLFLTQMIPAFIMARVFGWKQALSGGILLTARLGLTIATAQIGLSLGVISTADNAGIVTASILVSLLAPFGYRLLQDRREHRHHVYIMGGSKSSLMLAERFFMHNISCLTILQNHELAAEFDRQSLHHKTVDDLLDFVRTKLELRTADLVIILTESRQMTLDIAKHIKHEMNHGKIILRKQSASHELVDKNNEIKLVDSDEIIANHIEDMIVRPDAVSSLSESFGEYRVEEIRIANRAINRKLVKEVAFPPTGSLVIQRRGGEIFIPHGDTHLLVGDVLTVIGNGAALSEFRAILEE
jgi:Kef-type K+ transport system membrane component KefB/Trk K+ transport system NAD-binding subunit